MASLRKRGKVWFYRLIDADGIQRERKGCSDRRETERMASAAESEVAKIKAGLIDRKALAYLSQDAKPVTDHLQDWRTALVGNSTTLKHANQCHTRVAALLQAARVDRLSDLSVSKIQAAMASLRDQGMALRMVHHYIRNIKAFIKWLWRDGRIGEDRLAHLQPPPNPDSDRRRERRALTPPEITALVAAAENGPVVFKMSGIDRAMIYRLAIGTGFRARELQSLTPESFELATNPPTVTIEAGHSKRRRRDVQPIRSDLAAILWRWLSDKPGGARLFSVPSYHTAEMIRVRIWSGPASPMKRQRASRIFTPCGIPSRACWPGAMPRSKSSKRSPATLRRF